MKSLPRTAYDHLEIAELPAPIAEHGELLMRFANRGISSCATKALPRTRA
jgi:hypothetical protein